MDNLGQKFQMHKQKLAMPMNLLHLKWPLFHFGQRLFLDDYQGITATYWSDRRLSRYLTLFKTVS